MESSSRLDRIEAILEQQQQTIINHETRMAEMANFQATSITQLADVVRNNHRLIESVAEAMRANNDRVSQSLMTLSEEMRQLKRTTDYLLSRDG